MSLAFLNPWLLLGIASVSVPIIIHLLNKRKFERVTWAAMRFLRISVEQNQRRLRLEDILLLILRCTLLGLIAVALARPAMPAASAGLFGQAKVDAVVLLDGSASMTQTDGVRSRFERAKEAAEHAVDTLPSGSSVAVFLSSDVAQGIIPEPTYDLHLARKMIRELHSTHRASNHFPPLVKAIETLAGRPAVLKEIYLVTDGQALGWRQIVDIRQSLETSRKDIQTHIILVGGPEERNLGVSDLRLASGLAPIQQPIRFEVQVTNYGRHDAPTVHVSLRVDEDPPIEEAEIPLIPAGASKRISLFAKLRTEGYHTITAQIPPDRVPADDTRTVAIRGIRSLRVLLVDGEPGREPRDSEVFFIRHALQPIPPAETEQFFIQTHTVTHAGIEATKLDDYEAVFLANVTDFSPATLRAIENYLRRGGGLMIFTGANVNPAFYNDHLLNRTGILPAVIGPARGSAEQQVEYATLLDRNYAHPIISIWSDPAAGTLASARFYRRHELKLTPAPAAAPTAHPGPGAPSAEIGLPKVIARFTDGMPAIVERTWGLGRVILFASTAKTSWNDLPVRPAFVPLLHRCLGAIVQRQNEGLNVRVGEKYSFRASNEFVGREVHVLKPGQQEKLRDSRQVALAGGWPFFQYEETDWGGTYEAAISGDPPTVIKFAAQPDARESSLDEMPPPRLADALKGVATVTSWTAGPALENAIHKERVGTEYWLPLAFLALLLAAAETLLAHGFSRSK
jgi:hypothetical protein